MSHVISTALFTVDANGDYQSASRDAIVAAERQCLDELLVRGETMDSPATVKDFLSLKMGSYDREVFSAVFLDAQNRVIYYCELFSGTLTQTSVYPREVVKLGLQHPRSHPYELLCSDVQGADRRGGDGGRVGKGGDRHPEAQEGRGRRQGGSRLARARRGGLAESTSLAALRTRRDVRGLSHAGRFVGARPSDLARSERAQAAWARVGVG